MSVTTDHHRVAIVGTGFSGLGMAIRLKREGIEDFVVLERRDEVGGTWYDNTYPGCQCDVPSHLYSFSFAPNPNWSRTYSTQPEIEEYLRDCADRYGVIPHTRFSTEVLDASWDEEDRLWRLDTSAGAMTADVLVAGPGPLSEPSVPAIPGLDAFEGDAFHTADWNHDYDLTGKRVAVIGTGASAIQVVPKIQPEVEELHLVQRTPAWVLRHTDRPVSALERRLYHAVPALQRAVRAGIYLSREAVVPGFVYKPRLMRGVERMARLHLRRQVADPELRAKLTPDYSMGCKRILLSNDFYPALTQPNVEVHTGGLSEVRGSTIVAGDGTEREVDAIVFGTGFLVTEMPTVTRVRGRGGKALAELWDGSPQAYLGTAIAGCPNLFMLLGPNTGLGHNSMVYMIESQIAYVLDALRTMEKERIGTIEVRQEAQEAYNEHIQSKLQGTVWSVGGCASWYFDSNGRNTTLWPDFTWRYRRLTRRFDPAAYELGPPAEAAPKERPAALV